MRRNPRPSTPSSWRKAGPRDGATALSVQSRDPFRGPAVRQRDSDTSRTRGFSSPTLPSLDPEQVPPRQSEEEDRDGGKPRSGGGDTDPGSSPGIRMRRKPRPSTPSSWRKAGPRDGATALSVQSRGPFLGPPRARATGVMDGLKLLVRARPRLLGVVLTKA
jgi:hypothetical protein